LRGHDHAKSDWGRTSDVLHCPSLNERRNDLRLPGIAQSTTCSRVSHLGEQFPHILRIAETDYSRGVFGDELILGPGYFDESVLQVVSLRKCDGSETFKRGEELLTLSVRAPQKLGECLVNGGVRGMILHKGVRDIAEGWAPRAKKFEEVVSGQPTIDPLAKRVCATGDDRLNNRGMKRR
jgi:hypothetical protein